MEVEEIWEKGSVAAISDRVALEISEAQVSAQAGFPANALDGSIEDIDEPGGVLLVSVATHRRFIDTDLLATSGDQCFQLSANDGQECFGDRVSICILLIW